MKHAASKWRKLAPENLPHGTYFYWYTLPVSDVRRQRGEWNCLMPDCRCIREIVSFCLRITNLISSRGPYHFFELIQVKRLATSPITHSMKLKGQSRSHSMSISWIDIRLSSPSHSAVRILLSFSQCNLYLLIFHQQCRASSIIYLFILSERAIGIGCK